MKLTVYSFGTMADINIGDDVVLIEENKGEFTSISAYINAKKVGTCSESEHMLLPTTVSKTEATPMFKENGGRLEATVVDIDKKVTMANGRKASAFIIELVDLADNKSSEELVYKLKMGGTIQKCKGKTKIIKARRDGENVFGYIELTNDNKIAFYANVEFEKGKKELACCGICNEAEGIGLSSLSEIENLKNFLKVQKKADAVANDNFTTNTFELEVKITSDKKETLKEISINTVLDNIEKDEDEEYNKTVRNIVIYLQDNGFSAKQIEEIISSHDRTYDDTIKAKIPKEPKIKYLDTKEVNALKIGYGALKMGWHLLARGPKGSGKNEFTKTLAWVYQKPLYDLTFNRDVDKIDLQGGNTLEAVEENGVTKNTIKFAPEILLEAMECGGIFVADEINFAEPGILGLLNPITDTRCSIQVPGYRKIVAKKGFCLIGTMNEGYEGTNELNQALNDRFIHIPFEAPKTIYHILKQEYPTTADKYIAVADKIYKKILALVNGGSINPDCITIRGFIQAIPFIDILGQEKAFISCVANKVLDEKYREDILSCIKESVIL